AGWLLVAYLTAILSLCQADPTRGHIGRPLPSQSADSFRRCAGYFRLSPLQSQLLDRANSRKERIMSQPVLTLELPADVYERVRRAAKGMKQPVERALVTIVKAATPSLEKVPPEYRAELEAMEDLADEALWQAA